MYVRSRFALERQHAVVTENDVFYAVVVKGGEHHRANADIFGNRRFVVKTFRFFVQYGAGFFHGFVEDVFQKHDLSFAGAHCAVFHRNHAESDVLQILVPVVTHKFNDLKPLLKVQILLISHNVQAFIKVVSFLAIKRRGKVARGVKRRAVRL